MLQIEATREELRVRREAQLTEAVVERNRVFGFGEWCVEQPSQAAWDRYEQLLIDGMPVITDCLEIQQEYERMRLEGTAHTLAEMFALQTSPTVKSDATFLAGHCNGNQFADRPWLGDYYRQRAVEAGVNIQGAVYKSSLARSPGDPEAWVRSRGDVRRICEERGWGCQGDVKVKAREDVAPPADVDVAEDIVDQKVQQMTEACPELAFSRKPEEIREQARDAIKPHWAA